ncbi:MAG: phosphate signaling complex protein PhoU [Deltaproteobacteria bacterium]|nr:phosphate signaling complex protein PhoU [Deltaproteobacteria bacterium]
MTTHTDRHYEEELHTLKEKILKMGGMVEEMVRDAMKALVERQNRLASVVMKKEHEVNQLEIGIDDQCLRLLALHQPAASDLRFITLGLKISKDLERMGDLAVNITEQAEKINREPLLKPYVDLPIMADKAQKMVKGALDAFVSRDPDAAQKVCGLDDEVDDLKDKIQEELMAFMQKDSTAVVRGVHLIAIAKHLERVADHATNIAEEVIFMVKGKDIRHGGSRLT